MCILLNLKSFLFQWAHNEYINNHKSNILYLFLDKIQEKDLKYRRLSVHYHWTRQASHLRHASSHGSILLCLKPKISSDNLQKLNWSSEIKNLKLVRLSCYCQSIIIQPVKHHIGATLHLMKAYYCVWNPKIPYGSLLRCKSFNLISWCRHENASSISWKFMLGTTRMRRPVIHVV